MLYKESLLKNRKEIFRIASLHGAHNIRIFGSVKNLKDTPESDIDLLVDLEKGRSLLDLSGLAYDLEHLLGRKIDIVTENGLHWYIKETILEEAEPL
jgi:uncharacterized protein